MHRVPAWYVRGVEACSWRKGPLKRASNMMATRDDDPLCRADQPEYDAEHDDQRIQLREPPTKKAFTERS